MTRMPDLAHFCLKTGLYEEFQLDGAQLADLTKLERCDKPLDGYCVECGQDTVFMGIQKQPPLYGPGPISLSDTNDRVFRVDFACIRGMGHLMHFIFRIKSGVISKIGQSPSLADLQKASVKKYRRVLGEDKLRELTKGIGLYAHGVGIGAFVYLRRIFEGLISEAWDRASQVTGWDQDAYERRRMDERIEVLKGHLPAFLVEHRRIYSILSLGLHELSEQDCLSYFGTVQAGIELILDEKLAELERQEKIASTGKQIALLNQKLASRNNGG